MRWTFALRLRSVVATGAVARHAAMIETGSIPIDCRMTIRAVVRTLNVGRRFADGGAAVVTRGARPRDGAVIKSRIRPFLGGVTVPALVGAGYVTGLLPRGNDTVVTARASLRRAFEHALDMATATRDVSMPVIEGKARLDMDRTLIGGRRRCGARRHDADHQCRQHQRQKRTDNLPSCEHPNTADQSRSTTIARRCINSGP